jgi:hypothetical protein
MDASGNKEIIWRDALTGTTSLEDASGSVSLGNGDICIVPIGTGAAKCLIYYYHDYNTLATSLPARVKSTTAVGGWVQLDTPSFTRPLTYSSGSNLSATAVGKHVIATSSASQTIALPVTGLSPGDQISFECKVTAGLLTIDAGTTYLIDGLRRRRLWMSETCTLRWTGTEWTKIAGLSIPMQVSLTLDSAQSLTAETWTLASFKTVVKDTASLVSTAGAYFMPIREGLWTISANLEFTSEAGIDLMFSTNDSVLLADQIARAGLRTSSAINLTAEYSADSTDYIQAYVYSSTGQSLINAAKSDWLVAREIITW